MNSGKRKQRKFSPEFKLNVVLEGYATGNWSATAERHGLHITQVRVWKKQLLKDGAKTFLPKRKIYELLTIADAKQAIVKFIKLYNSNWIHGEIGNMTPDQKLEQYRSYLRN